MAEGDRSTVHEGIAALVGQLADDAREVASAEIGLVKARVTDGVTRFRAAAILFAVAGVLLLATLIALLVGLIQTIAHYTGAGFATAIVCGGALVIAAILALIGKGKLTQRPPAA